MDEWKQVISAANQAFGVRDFSLAERRYTQACRFLEQHLATANADKGDLIAAMVVSYANLAELYFKQQRFDVGFSQYIQLHQQLQQCECQFADCLQTQLMVSSARRQMGTQLMHALKENGVNFQEAWKVLRTLFPSSYTLH
ncbi:hypothetical protein [Gallaecimonas mangrovi]|uniref:hypothetical protein n=1 Tax=Gallaecimonas mangrovi TaxID=2291597 RepID=UPI000E207909|nr:hypothetical protein [Gallaecimonas mangrovi]